MYIYLYLYLSLYIYIYIYTHYPRVAFKGHIHVRPISAVTSAVPLEWIARETTRGWDRYILYYMISYDIVLCYIIL